MLNQICIQILYFGRMLFLFISKLYYILIHYSRHLVHVFSWQETAISIWSGICLAGSNGREQRDPEELIDLQGNPSQSKKTQMFYSIEGKVKGALHWDSLDVQGIHLDAQHGWALWQRKCALSTGQRWFIALLTIIVQNQCSRYLL